MPPLLPEYLSQPVQVAIQSLPSADSWPVWLSAAATLLGSFGGALLGGVVAYKSTIKANSALLKRQKLEEALTIVLDVKTPIHSMERMISLSSWGEFQEENNERAAKLIAAVDYKKIQRLETLLRIYGDKLFFDATALGGSITILNFQIGLANALKESPQNIEILSSSCVSSVDNLEKELVKRLSL